MTPPFPDQKYRLIYADPPWSYADARTHASAGMARSAYSVMPLEEICALPVRELAEKDCMCALWCTLPKLREGLYVLGSWGFEYVTTAFVWVKLRPNHPPTCPWINPLVDIYSGLGHYTNANAELVLLGRRGKAWREARNVKQIVLSPRGRHSAKPPEVRDRLVRLFGNVSRIELFAREKTPGWHAWGLEVRE